MPLRSFHNRRDANEAQLVAALRKSGAKVRLTDKPTDAVCHYRGEVHLLEFKTPKGALTLSQKELLAEGWPVHVIRSLDDVAEFISNRTIHSKGI